jgi:hypothetical protein
MTCDHSDFSDRLVAVESLSTDSRQKLQTELHQMFVRKLGRTQRIFLSVVAIGALASAAVCGGLAITEEGLPTLARTGLGVGSLFGLAWAAMAIRLCRRGTMDLQRDNRQIAAMVWVFTVLMMVFFLIMGMSTEDRLLGLMLIANGLAFLIGAAVHMLSCRIEQAELGTREQLLRLELQLAELRKGESTPLAD